MKDSEYLKNELLNTNTGDPSVNLKNSLENLKFQTKLIENSFQKLGSTMTKLKDSLDTLAKLDK